MTDMLKRMRESGGLRVDVRWGNKAISWLSVGAKSPMYSNEQLHVYGRVSRHSYESLDELNKVSISFNNDKDV